MDTTNLAELYDLPPMDWAAGGLPPVGGTHPGARRRWAERHTCWLTTLNEDGSPHVTGLGMEWARDAWWFSAGRGSQKLRNLRRDPRCAVAVAALEFDLVVEGTYEEVDDPDLVAWYAAQAAEGGWPAASTRAAPRSPPTSARRPRAAAVARAPDHPDQRVRRADRGAGWRDALGVLTPTRRI